MSSKDERIKAAKEANWSIARARWEGEPKLTFADLTTLLGVSKQAIAKRAAKTDQPGGRWQKKLSMSNIVEKAHAAADAIVAQNSADAPSTSKEKARVVAPENKTNVVAPPGKPPAAGTQEQLDAAVEGAAVSARADVLARHRTELNVGRAKIYKSLNNTDFVTAKKVKANIEALKILQDAERKAWGLDAGEEKPVVVIERRGGRAD